MCKKEFALVTMIGKENIVGFFVTKWYHEYLKKKNLSFKSFVLHLFPSPFHGRLAFNVTPIDPVYFVFGWLVQELLLFTKRIFKMWAHDSISSHIIQMIQFDRIDSSQKAKKGRRFGKKPGLGWWMMMQTPKPRTFIVSQ